jgi:hypothetical protein
MGECVCIGHAGDCGCLLHGCHEGYAYRQRAEAAEAALAALRAAWANVLRREVKSAHGAGGYEQRSLWDLRDVFADTRAAAEAYRARVRAEVLREAADRAAAEGWARAYVDWLRAMADEEGR